MEENKNNKGKVIGGLVFVGFMFLGLGIGWLYGSIPIGVIIGMGIGFLAMAITIAYYSKGKDSADI